MTVAFSPAGLALGVLQLDADFRVVDATDARDQGDSQRWLDGFHRRPELAAARPRRHVIVLGDRESDIWSVLTEGLRSAANDSRGLLVRRVALRADGCRPIRERRTGSRIPMGGPRSRPRALICPRVAGRGLAPVASVIAASR